MLPENTYARISLVAVAALVLVESVCIFTGVFVPKSWRMLHHVFHDFLQPDDAFLYKVRPNLRDLKTESPEGQVSQISSTDEFGFRNVGRDYAHTRIFFVGDSMVWGSWVTREDGLCGVVEAELGEPVINLGVGSYEFGRYESIFREFVAKYKPAVAALGVFPNDLIPPLPALGGHPGAGEEYYSAHGWDKYEHFPIYKRTLTYYLIDAVRRFFGGGTAGHDEYNLALSGHKVASNGLTLFRHRGASKNYLKDRSAIRHVQNHMSNIIRICAENKVKLVVFLFPSKESTYKHDYQKLFPDSADYILNEEVGYEMLCNQIRANGVVCVNLTEVFRQHGEKELLYFPLDPHWNIAGNRLAGREAAKVLRKLE